MIWYIILTIIYTKHLLSGFTPFPVFSHIDIMWITAWHTALSLMKDGDLYAWFV